MDINKIYINKIYIFGSTGMLGTYVTKILSNDFNIICITREMFDILNDNWSKLVNILDSYKINEKDYIINCAGAIHQKTNETDFKKYIKLNALFPQKLSDLIVNYSAKLIHITTDCVFDGISGKYDENHVHNNTDIYGITKSLGEPENCCVIRTSIIGHELKEKKNLLEWILSNKNKTIYGYTNHIWNGVSCLTLSNIIKEMIEKKIFWEGVRHIFSPNIVSKYELCNMVNDIYNLNINIQKKENKITINRHLISKNKIPFNIPELKLQIIAQKNFNLIM